ITLLAFSKTMNQEITCPKCSYKFALDEALNRDIELQVRKQLSEEFKKKESELRRELSREAAEKAERSSVELQAKVEAQAKELKAEQGWQKLQGDVQELELEKALRERFPRDEIESVKSGARGADVLQKVISDTGQLCGTILWESKRVRNWSDRWIDKLIDDKQ